MLPWKRLGMGAVLAGLVAVGVTAMPHDANAWWQGGYGVGVVVPPVVVAPPVFVAPPVVAVPAYRPPVYVAPGYGPPPVGFVAPRRVWVPSHWAGPHWVRGHWG